MGLNRELESDGHADDALIPERPPQVLFAGRPARPGRDYKTCDQAHIHSESRAPSPVRQVPKQLGWATLKTRVTMLCRSVTSRLLEPHICLNVR